VRSYWDSPSLLDSRAATASLTLAAHWGLPADREMARPDRKQMRTQAKLSELRGSLRDIVDSGRDQKPDWMKFGPSESGTMTPKSDR
jgi:hypothetical protein